MLCFSKLFLYFFIFTASNISLDTEEEFFECEEFSESEEVLRKDIVSSWDKPEGRLKRFGNARLINDKDFIYVPITQDAVPRTEDSLEEQTEELLKLGTEISGSFQRAKVMSASLLSDMESFKVHELIWLIIKFGLHS